MNKQKEVDCFEITYSDLISSVEELYNAYKLSDNQFYDITKILDKNCHLSLSTSEIVKSLSYLAIDVDISESIEDEFLYRLE